MTPAIQPDLNRGCCAAAEVRPSMQGLPAMICGDGCASDWRNICRGAPEKRLYKRFTTAHENDYVAVTKGFQ
jgi:hypothetical protein